MRAVPRKPEGLPFRKYSHSKLYKESERRAMLRHFPDAGTNFNSFLKWHYSVCKTPTEEIFFGKNINTAKLYALNPLFDLLGRKP